MLKNRPNISITDAATVLRIARLIFFLQTLAVIYDHPTVQLPPFCYTFLKGPLYYTTHFYSKPFVDVLFAIRSFYSSGTPTGDTGTDWLSSNFSLDVLDEQYWHALQHISHFALSFFFCITAVYITLQFWSVRDYTDQQEVREWLRLYVDRLWLARGGALLLLRAMQLALLFAGLVVFFVCLAAGMDAGSLPDARVSGALLLLALVVLLGLALASLSTAAFTRSLFLKFASQNADHTSVIILKEVLKSKAEAGLTCMLAMFLPALCVLTKAIMGNSLLPSSCTSHAICSHNGLERLPGTASPTCCQLLRGLLLPCIPSSPP